MTAYHLAEIGAATNFVGPVKTMVSDDIYFLLGEDDVLTAASLTRRAPVLVGLAE